VASCVALLATLASALLAAGAEGDTRRSASQDARVAAALQARAVIDKAAATVPLAVDGECVETAVVPGQGPSCRTRDGMYLVPQADGPALMTHGPDVVDAAPRSGRGGGFGTTSSIVCSPASRTRHVQLLYLLPSDYATPGDLTHGDRSATEADALRQAFYDVSELIDRRAQQLAGQRRRVRVLCDADGRPSVERVVLLHTAKQFLDSSNGFRMMGDDLATLGYLPDYGDFSTKHLPAVRRLLGYYDAEFRVGYAGQGTLYPRTSMIGQGISSRDPLVGKTSRNINNNPPKATLAIQYANSSFVGGTAVPEEPLFTSLAHELSHTMGAVQDEPPTSSKVGHCIDGLDIMCYADGGEGTYAETYCPDPAPPYAAEDEVYDCNADTYFHPAPPAGNPLADAITWNLGSPANETLATHANGAPAAVASVTSSGSGTKRTLTWPAAAGASGYEVAYRRPGGSWEYLAVSGTSAVPPLRPSSDYELRVGAVGAGDVLGPTSATTLRTGLDNSPPVFSGLPAPQYVLRTSLLLRYEFPLDNVKVAKLRLEKRVGTRWVLHATLLPPRGATAGARATAVVSGLRAGTRYLLRLRAVDARGNVSAPSRSVAVTTRR
jgi:hypothetical protein